MSVNPNSKFNENTNIFLKFIMDLFIDSSDDISEILVYKAEIIVYKSKWNDSEIIFNLVDNWKTSDEPFTFSLNNAKFIKLHNSPFNLVYRSIEGQKGLIGTKFQMNSEVKSLFAMVKQTETMQLGLTAMKDIIISIIELCHKKSKIVISDSNNLQIGITFPENKHIIKKFIESLKTLQFICEYTDKGDSINFNFKYEKKERKIYPDYMYK